MKLFHSSNLNDVIFLEPVRKIDEKLPKGKMRMLYCDVAGKVYTAIINTKVYKIAIDSLAKMEANNKDYATLGLEIGPGNFLPLVVEISPREVRVLEHVLEHARKSGVIPHILKKELRHIIKLGDTGRKVRKADKRNNDLTITTSTSPGVLNRLPYYSELEIEFSMPIYKAFHKYPLIVLNWLPPDKQSQYDSQRLLIMDGDGDLAVIRAPFKLMAESRRKLETWAAKTDIHACIIIGRGAKGLDINYLMISQQQKKALDMITRRFEETGSGEKYVTVAAAKKVLIQARDVSTPPTD